MVLKEPELFSYLKEFYYPDLAMSDDKFSKYDCISNDHKLYIELKSRNTHYPDLLIEKIKYDAIVEHASKLNYRPIYINSTPEGIWMFDLLISKPRDWIERWLPQNTEFSNRGNKTKVIGYLFTEQGLQL